MNISPYIAHVIGDFILQNEWMAIGKRQSSWACLVHVLVYLIPFMFVGWTWWQLLLLGAVHYSQDRTNFVYWWVNNYKKVPNDNWHTVPLLVDQAFHLVQIQIVISLASLA